MSVGNAADIFGEALVIVVAFLIGYAIYKKFHKKDKEEKKIKEKEPGIFSNDIWEKKK